MVKGVKTLHAKPHDTMRRNGAPVRNEADTAGVVVLQRVVERKSVHSPISVGAQKVSLVNCFTKSVDRSALENFVAPWLLCGAKQRVHESHGASISPDPARGAIRKCVPTPKIECAEYIQIHTDVGVARHSLT